MEVAGIFVALASEGLIVFPLSFLCERIQYNRQMGKYFKHPLPRVYPRMCGVDETNQVKYLHVPGLSPRVRGRWNAVDLMTLDERFIPACAG